MPTIIDVRTFREFLKDESVAAALKCAALSGNIALAIITAVKPANLSPACRACGRPMRFGRAISKFRHHPELRIYECDECRETVLEEWRPREDGGRQMPNSRQGATTLAAGLTVLRKEWGIRNFDMAVILGTWAGSIGFGWKQQPYWLVVPIVVCVAYMPLIGCRCPWAARRLGRGVRKIHQTLMSGRTAGLALFNLVASWRWVGLGGRFQKKQDDVPHHDLALGVRRRPCCFLRTRKLVLSSHEG